MAGDRADRLQDLHASAHTYRSSGALPHLLESWPHSVLPSALTQLLPVYLLSRWRRWEKASAGDAANASVKRSASSSTYGRSSAERSASVTWSMEQGD